LLRQRSKRQVFATTDHHHRVLGESPMEWLQLDRMDRGRMLAGEQRRAKGLRYYFVVILLLLQLTSSLACFGRCRIVRRCLPGPDRGGGADLGGRARFPRVRRVHRVRHWT
jgi:hypothetical protein